jgi:hypothetical protein
LSAKKLTVKQHGERFLKFRRGALERAFELRNTSCSTVRPYRKYPVMQIKRAAVDIEELRQLGTVMSLIGFSRMS